QRTATDGNRPERRTRRGATGEFKGRWDRSEAAAKGHADWPARWGQRLLWFFVHPQVPAKLKLLAMFAAFYVLSPIDLVPGGLLGPLGWLDDILIALYAWNRAGGILRRGPWAARAGQG